MLTTCGQSYQYTNAPIMEIMKALTIYGTIQNKHPNIFIGLHMGKKNEVRHGGL